MPSHSLSTEEQRRILGENIVHAVSLTAVQLDHAEKVKGRAKSGYYKVACQQLAPIVEALAYSLLDREVRRGKDLPANADWEYFDAHPLPKKFITDRDRWYLCKRRREKVHLSPKLDFSKIIDFSEKMGIYKTKKGLARRCHWVRDLRNRIHLQGLDDVDRRYNKATVDKISKTIEDLMNLTRR